MNGLKIIRRLANMTQVDLAKSIGVTQSMVAKWENGEAYPRGEILIKLADVFHCSIDELFGRDSPVGAGQDSA